MFTHSNEYRYNIDDVKLIFSFSAGTQYTSRSCGCLTLDEVENMFCLRCCTANSTSGASNSDCARSSAPLLPGKKGAAFTLRDEGQKGTWKENLPKVIALRPYWNYSWGSKRIDLQPNDVEFIPMIWCGNNLERMKQSLETDVINHVKNGTVKRILGFNEPDEKTQSNMSVECALERWPVLQSLGISMISPSCAKPAGDWMKSFMARVDADNDDHPPPRAVDWVGVHWYGGANVIAFQNCMIQLHELYQRPILITEFAPADWAATTVATNRFSPAKVLAFMKEALPWLESQDWVAGYCWFSFTITQPQGTSSALFDENGNLTPCGQFYASVRTEKPSGDTSIRCL